MCSHVPLQLGGVLAGIAAEGALKRALTRVRADMALQLARLVNKRKIFIAMEMSNLWTLEMKQHYKRYVNEPNVNIRAHFTPCKTC